MVDRRLIKKCMEAFNGFHSKISRMRSFVPVKGISEKYAVNLIVNQKGMEK